MATQGIKRKAFTTIRHSKQSVPQQPSYSMFLLLVLLVGAVLPSVLAFGVERIHTRTLRRTFTPLRDGGNSFLNSKAFASSSIDLDTQEGSMLSTSYSDEHVVDDYLEFLDRRYRRLHEAETTSSNSNNENMKVPFSVWKWLYQEVELPPTHSQQQDDALYVLGVAGLASKRLLQKHHLPVQKLEEEEVKPIDVSAAVVVKPLSQLLSTRQRLIAFQRQKLSALSQWMMRRPVHLARALWKWAGGTETVTRTLSLAFCMVLLSAKLLSILITNDPTNSS